MTAEPAPQPPEAGARPDPTGPVRVLYLAGSGRSGSTLVDSVLGQLPGVCSAGEVRYLWERGVVADRLCGCGRPFSECPTWRGALARAGRPVDAQAMMRAQRSRLRLRHLHRLVLDRWRGRPVDDPTLAALPAVYRGIRDQSGAAVVVDSSKLPTYGALLSDLSGLDVRVLHVVRDPRATAYSWTRSKVLRDYGDERLMQQQPPWKAALLWLVWNVTTGLAWRRGSLRVRYEDFVADPATATRAIAEFAGVTDDPALFRPGPEVLLAPTHSVAGNPSRHRTGWVPVRRDDEWVERLPRRDAWLVTALTWPLLLRYGYPLRPRAVTRGG